MKLHKLLVGLVAAALLTQPLAEARNPRGGAVGATNGPTAPVSFELINQGGQDNGRQGFAASFLGSSNSVSNGASISKNYDGFTWLAATPGTGGAVSKYNVYRQTLTGTTAGGFSLYDSISTPISVTGYIAQTVLSNVQVTAATTNACGGTNVSFNTVSPSLKQGQLVTVTGTNSGTGSLTNANTGATDGVYYIFSTNGTTTAGLCITPTTGVTTVIGTLTGLTFTMGPTLTVTAVSGGSSTNAISDGKLLPGCSLTGGGVAAGTTILQYMTANNGGGGTGYYTVNVPQTLGSSGSPVTMQCWAYNDTAATNANVYNFSDASTVYQYELTAVDASSNEGPAAFPNAYMYQGSSYIQNATTDSYGGVVQNNADTTGGPVNGPYDVSLVYNPGGGYLPAWTGAGPNSNGSISPVQHFEGGGFNFITMDILFADNAYQTHNLQYIPVMRGAGVLGGVDSAHWLSVNLPGSYCGTVTVGAWVTCKIPFSNLPYGVTNIASATFHVTGQYFGTLTVTTMGAGSTSGGIDGASYLIGPGLRANLYESGSATATLSAASTTTSTSVTATFADSSATNPFAGVPNLQFNSVGGMTQLNGTYNLASTGGSSGAWTATVTTPTNTGWGAYTSGGWATVPSWRDAQSNGLGVYTSGPWVFHFISPNIVGNESDVTWSSSTSYFVQGSSFYKHGWQWAVTPSCCAQVYMNNIGVTTN